MKYFQDIVKCVYLLARIVDLLKRIYDRSELIWAKLTRVTLYTYTIIHFSLSFEFTRRLRLDLDKMGNAALRPLRSILSTSLGTCIISNS